MQPLSNINPKALSQLKISLASAMVIVAIYLLGGFDAKELELFDSQTRMFREEIKTHPDVVIVMIDDVSLFQKRDTLGRWPWPRHVYADLLEFFQQGNAAAVAFDILFTEYEQIRADQLTFGQNDQRLAAATAASGNVIHAMMLTHETPNEMNKALIDRPLPDGFKDRFARSNSHRLPSDNNYYLPFPELYRDTAGMGIIEISPDPDGRFRRMSLMRNYHDAWFPALSLAAILQVAQPKQVDINQQRLSIDKLEVPLDGNGRYRINFYGDYEIISAAKILDSIELLRNPDGTQPPVRPEDFTNKIVLLGASAAALVDLKSTPLADLTPGVLIHASIISNFLNNDFLVQTGPFITLLLIGLMTAAALLLTQRLPSLWQRSSGLLAIATVYTFICFIAFTTNTLLEISPPLSALFLSALSLFMYEHASIRHVSTTPNQLPETQTPESKSALILRIDLASERQTPLIAGDIATPWGDVLSEATALGAHTSFMSGHSVEIFWPYTGHEDQSTAAQQAYRLSQKITTTKGENSHLYSAICSGQVTIQQVTADKRQHTVLWGPAHQQINRCLEIARQLSRPLIVDESVYTAIKDDVAMVPVEQYQVNADGAYIRLYRPLTRRERQSSNGLDLSLPDLWHEALGHYLKREWQLVLDLVRMLPESREKTLIIERCKHYLVEPPDDDWNGSLLTDN